jgi:hypothetical protein
VAEPLFLPTEAGARDVLRRARRRRRRQVALAALGVAAATLAGTLAAFPATGVGTDRVTVVPTSPTPQPSERAGHPDAVATEHKAAAPAHGTAPVPPASGVVAPEPRTQDAPASSPTPTAPTHRKSAAAPIRRTTVSYRSGCDPTTTDGVGWCERYSGPATARRKHPVAFSLDLCRLPVAGDGRVTFGNSREVSLELFNSNADREWQAGQGERYRATTHTVTVRAGTCLRWTSSWDTVGPDGFYAPPGAYDLSYGLNDSDISATTAGIQIQLTD